MLAKYKLQNTALPMSQIILIIFERLPYTSCNIVNVDHNKNVNIASACAKGTVTYL